MYDQKAYEPLPFLKDPANVEVVYFLLFVFAAILVVGLVKAFRSVQWLTDRDPLNFKEENHIVSPFLISEREAGTSGVYSKRVTLWARILVFVMIAVFLLIPLWDVYPPPEIYQGGCTGCLCVNY